MSILSYFWPPETGKTLFDVSWSIIHLAFWVFVGGDWYAICLSKGWQVPTWASLLGAFVLAYVWELIEHFWAEPAGLVAHHEIWINRWIGDPLIAPVALLLGMWLIKNQ